MGKLNQDPTQAQTKDNRFPQEFPRILDAPTFDLSKVRSTIPKQCWERNTCKSIFYFAKDYSQIIVTFLVFSQIIFPHFSTSMTLSLITWVLYSTIQGTLMWCLFVIGHDCGHKSFSENDFISHFFGHLSHTPLLVPYHPWRISHSLHHANHGNLHKDEAYVAITRTQYKEISEKWPIIKFFRYEGYLLGGWTLYLIYGMPQLYRGHFMLSSEIFKGRSETELNQVRLSLTLWWSFFLFLIIVVPYYFGVLSLFQYYVGAYFVCGGWVSLVTLLHHTHPDAPWYRTEAWDYQRGALTTIDRDYGVLESFHHNVGTHTIHHLFTRIPHYHLKEANKAVRPILGEYYKLSRVSIWQMMVKIWHQCRFVADEGSVVFYEPAN
eukprot:TRINITY_DN12317_c0_g1_i1.p1 TRINITY_DN12317_c0_g1~~TRINITY_DN12317_c0_g1_i1.p1  ORF type:complete len:379 (+),score=29.06 TRINITY_DN12317_c0_g1_i1:72-1208(+)